MAAVAFTDEAVSGTLTTGSVTDTVTMTNPGPFEITNMDGTNALWVRLDGSAATAAGANCIPVMAGKTRRFAATPTSTFSIVSDSNTGTNKYTVSRVLTPDPVSTS